MKALRNYIKDLNTPPGPPTQQGIYASPEWTGQPYPSIDWEAITQNQEPPEGWPRPPKFNELGDVPGPPVQFGDPITPETVEAGFNFVDNGVVEKNMYFYHPDHLGSSSNITDINGDLSQHTEFMAFGEILFDEHSTSIAMPYLFNGKELDQETNLTYYGARYLDMKTSLWLNVDPLADKYPETSAYTYVANNPVIYIDPDGRDLILSFATSGAMDSYTSIVNTALVGKYQVNLVPISGTSNYKVEISTLNSKAKLTSEQKKFYKQLNKVISADEVVNQSVVENDANTVVDSWITGKIDIKDVEAFDVAGTGAASSAGALTHSHVEQLKKSKKGLSNGDVGATKTDASGNIQYIDYEKAHKKAIKAENRVNGNTRGVNSNENIFREKDGTKTVQTITPKSSGGIKVQKEIIE